MDMNSTAASTKATCPMKMVFHGGHCERILWESWVASTYVEFTFSCLALGLMAFILEAIKFWREYLIKKEKQRQLIAMRSKNSDGACSNTQLTMAQEPTYMQRICTKPHVVQTLLYALQMIDSYLVMLAFMNFNYWMCLAMILGLGIGYFFFGWIKQDAYETGDCCS